MNTFLKEKLNGNGRGNNSRNMIKFDRYESIALLCYVMKESITSFQYAVKENLGNIGRFLYLSVPYISILCERNGMLSNWFLTMIIPLVLIYIVYILRTSHQIYHNRTVDNIPLPYKRFTEEQTGGVVTVEEGRLEELLLYVNDLENELERLGKL